MCIRDRSDIKKQKSDPEKIRGIEISRLSTEKVREEKELKQAYDLKMQRIFYGLCAGYLLFFAFLYKMLLPLQAFLKQAGLGLQLLAMTGILIGINRLFKAYAPQFHLLKNKVLSDMLQVYAFIWMLIAIVLANDLPRNLFGLAP